MNPYAITLALVELTNRADAVRSAVVTFRDNLQGDGFTRAQANRIAVALFAGTGEPEAVKAAIATPTRKADA